MRTTNLYSNDLSCPSCIAKIEGRLTRLPGVEAAKVHFTTGRIEVRHNPEQVEIDQLLTAVNDAGYQAVARGF